MSLATLAIRACTFLALYRATLAEERVYDSALAPVDELRSDAPRPFITVAVDEATGKPEGNNLLGSTDTLAIVIEMAVGRAVLVNGTDGAVVIPHTEPGLEWALDILAHQVVGRLMADQVWGDLWRQFVMDVREVIRVRGAVADTGERVAARQIIIQVHPLADPPFGAPPEDTPWTGFLAALRAIDLEARPELAAYVGLADAVEKALGSPDDLLDWQVAAAHLGVGRDTAETLGITPAVSGATEDDITAITLFGDTVDDERADEIGDPTDDDPPPNVPQPEFD